jgi:signal transduction histidine kinase
LGYLELLEDEEKTESVERYISIISNRVDLLKQLTEELFQYSVIAASKNHTIKEKIILNEMLEESIAGFYAALKECNIEPNVQMPKTKVIRYLNPSTLSRVLSNLLNNGDLDVTLTQAGKIIFTNTASGLNEVQVGKLFDRFYTVEAARDSTGLGLAITRTLIEQMKGTISAEYENNKLSICILLPDCSQSHQM